MKIIAIGGGEIGRPGTPIETGKIDRELIKLSGKKHPRLLFIPTASSDSDGYVEVVRKYFGKRLGCRIDVLFLFKKNLQQPEIRAKILGADIIYVGGGNTLKMMKRWRKLGVDQTLESAAQKGIVLSGVSAGAICWFRFGNSDSRRFTDPKAPLIRVRGLDLVPALCCPHYNGKTNRKASLNKMVRGTPGVAIALDNCSAIEIIDEKFRILASKPKAHAYQVYWTKGKFVQRRLIPGKTFRPLSEIMTKFTKEKTRLVPN